jgi:hypothetical protein
LGRVAEANEASKIEAGEFQASAVSLGAWRLPEFLLSQWQDFRKRLMIARLKNRAVEIVCVSVWDGQPIIRERPARGVAARI